MDAAWSGGWRVGNGVVAWREGGEDVEEGRTLCGSRFAHRRCGRDEQQGVIPGAAGRAEAAW